MDHPSPTPLPPPSRLVIGLGIGLVLLGIGVGLGRWHALKQNTLTPTSTALTPTPVPRVQVAALGRLEPSGEVIQVGGPAGSRIDRLLVAQGDWVEAKQILAYLDSYDERQAERDLAQSQLQEAEARLTAETRFQEAQIQTAKTRIGQIDRPQVLGIEAQKSRIAELQASLALAQENLQRDQNLQQQGAIPQRELDQRQTTVTELQAQITSAQATLVQLEASRSNDLKNAEAQLQAAQANLTLSQVQTAVDSARQSLVLAQTRLDDTMIRAPQAGRVLRIITHQGEAIASTATGANAGIVELGNTRQMMAVAEVYESDVPRVKVGQPVTINSRNGAFTETLTGEVVNVGWQIFKNNILDDDPAATSDARVVEVKIRINESDRVEALTNLQVDVYIQTQP